MCKAHMHYLVCRNLKIQCARHTGITLCVVTLKVNVQGAQHTSVPLCVSYPLESMCTTHRHYFVCRNLKIQCARHTGIILCVVTLKFNVHDTQALFCVSYPLKSMCTTHRHYFVCRNLTSQCVRRTAHECSFVCACGLTP